MDRHSRRLSLTWTKTHFNIVINGIHYCSRVEPLFLKSHTAYILRNKSDMVTDESFVMLKSQKKRLPVRVVISSSFSICYSVDDFHFTQICCPLLHYISMNIYKIKNCCMFTYLLPAIPCRRSWVSDCSITLADEIVLLCCLDHNAYFCKKNK